MKPPPRTALRDYLIQVSLIILSVLLALGIDRCRAASQDKALAAEYQTRIRTELDKEEHSNTLNLVDATNDLSDLNYVLTQAPTLGPATADSTYDHLIRRLALVLVRGVFRTFTPTVYERISANGEARLVPDIELRARLDAYAAFRHDYIQADLNRHDALVLETIDRVGDYLDLNCVQNHARSAGPRPPGLRHCITDYPALRRRLARDVGKLTRHTQLRLFHLERGQATLAAARKRLDV